MKSGIKLQKKLKLNLLGVINFYLKWFSIHFCSDALHKNTRTDVFIIITPNKLKLNNF